ncbi:MAG: MMPL family transporter [Rhodomicrobium sp.]|nr:MMPL family transporter [Rhodomicrobium sp.]
MISMVPRYTAWLQRWKFAVLAAGLIVLVLGAIGMQRVVFDPDVLVYFDRNMPERQALETIENRFGRTNEIVFVLRAKGGGSMIEGKRLEAVVWLSDRAKALDGAIAARSPLDLLGDNAPRRAIHDGKALREAAAKAGYSARAVLSADETVTSVAAIYPRSSHADIDIRSVASSARALQKEFRQRFPDIENLMTGRLMMDQAFLYEGQQDTYDYAALQTVILSLILLITFRSVYASAILIVIVLTSSVATLGIAGWSGFPLNGISSAAPTVLMGLAVATGIHIVLAWQRARAKGMGRAAAVSASLRFNAAPVLLSVVTTIASFLCLNLAASPPFGQLGNVVSIGLVIVLVLSFTLLPALLLIAPKGVSHHSLALAPAMRRLGWFVITKRRALLLVFAAIAALSVEGVSKISFDDTFSHYFDQRFEVRRATDLFEDKLSGTIFIDLSVPVSDKGGPFSRAHLERLKTFSDWLKKRHEFAEAVSLETVTAALARQSPALFDAEGLPVRPEAANALRHIYDRMRLEGLIGLIDNGGQHARISVVLRGVSSSETLASRATRRRKRSAFSARP